MGHKIATCEIVDTASHNYQTLDSSLPISTALQSKQSLASALVWASANGWRVVGGSWNDVHSIREDLSCREAWKQWDMTEMAIEMIMTIRCVVGECRTMKIWKSNIIPPKSITGWTFAFLSNEQTRGHNEGVVRGSRYLLLDAPNSSPPLRFPSFTPWGCVSISKCSKWSQSWSRKALLIPLRHGVWLPPLIMRMVELVFHFFFPTVLTPRRQLACSMEREECCQLGAAVAVYPCDHRASGSGKGNVGLI